MRVIAPLLVALVLVVTPTGRAAADEDLRSSISVVGDGRVLVDPDVALVGVGVETSDVSLDAAQAEAARRLQAVVDTLLARGVVREDIRTTRLSVSPIYAQQDRAVVRGYRVSSSVQAKLRDLANAGATVDAVVASGANRVDGISFLVDDPTPPKDQARALALANARAKADQLAALAGLRIVGVKAIVESDPTSTPVRPPAAAPEARPAAAPAPTPVEPGQQEVRTQVSVTYIVE